MILVVGLEAWPVSGDELLEACWVLGLKAKPPMNVRIGSKSVLEITMELRTKRAYLNLKVA
jgi:hypothetical protein